MPQDIPLQPYLQHWLLVQAPAAVLIALWLTAAARSQSAARWAWLASAIAGSLAAGLAVASVVGGAATDASLGLFRHVGWIGLAAALVLGDRRRTRAHIWSFALAAGAAAVHAWLLALALVVTGHPERSGALRAGLAVSIVASWAGDHLAWRGLDLLGRTGLSLDVTGVVMAWCNGLFVLAGWAITVVAVERLRSEKGPPPPKPAAGSG